MGRLMFYSIKLYFLIYFVTICYGQENSRGPKRTRVSPYASIIPFLRTGRSQIHMPLAELETGDDPIKRAKSGRTIMAFPRVGRSGTMEWGHDDGWSGIQKKSGGNSNMNNGLWFGPRLGRIHKRQEYKKDLPMAYVYFGDYTPRLGRESEETMDDVNSAAEDQENDKSILESV